MTDLDRINRELREAVKSLRKEAEVHQAQMSGLPGRMMHVHTERLLSLCTKAISVVDALDAANARVRELERIIEAEERARGMTAGQWKVVADEETRRAKAAEARAARLQAALEPFAKDGRSWSVGDSLDFEDAEPLMSNHTELTIGDLRKAARVLADTAPDASDGRAADG